MITQLLKDLSNVKNIYPESHLRVLVDAGFEMDLSNKYSPSCKHLISYAGRYFLQLINGSLNPISQQQECFIQAIKGKVPAANNIERDFLIFMSEYPEEIKNIFY